MQHTILGAGGSIGNALTHELLKSGENVRQVSRSKYEIAGTESVKADLTSYHETAKSVQNSDIVYLCAGLPYNSKIWNEQWPRIIVKMPVQGLYSSITCTCMVGWKGK